MASISAVGSLDQAFDLVEREGVEGALVPIALAIDGVENKPGCLGGEAPVVAFGAGEALHGRPLAAAVGVEMPVQPQRCAAETAIGHAAIFPSRPSGSRTISRRVRDRNCFALQSPSTPRRRPGPHHGQKDAARAFHAVAPSWILLPLFTHAPVERGKLKRRHFRTAVSVLGMLNSLSAPGYPGPQAARDSAPRHHSEMQMTKFCDRRFARALAFTSTLWREPALKFWLNQIFKEVFMRFKSSTAFALSISTLALTWSVAAVADPQQQLRGSYGFTGAAEMSGRAGLRWQSQRRATASQPDARRGSAQFRNSSPTCGRTTS